MNEKENNDGLWRNGELIEASPDYKSSFLDQTISENPLEVIDAEIKIALIEDLYTRDKFSAAVTEEIKEAAVDLLTTSKVEAVKKE